MPHIHKLIDFTITCYIVHAGKVLLVDHAKYDIWLPVGGHIELDEDPEQALVREITEESGLEVEILGDKPAFPEEVAKSLIAPQYMNIHYVDATHRHMDMIFFAKAKTNQTRLASAEHNEIRWFTREELSDPQYSIKPHIRFYAEEALRKME